MRKKRYFLPLSRGSDTDLLRYFAGIDNRTKESDVIKSCLWAFLQKNPCPDIPCNGIFTRICEDDEMIKNRRISFYLDEERDAEILNLLNMIEAGKVSLFIKNLIRIYTGPGTLFKLLCLPNIENVMFSRETNTDKDAEEDLKIAEKPKAEKIDTPVPQKTRELVYAEKTESIKNDKITEKSEKEDTAAPRFDFLGALGSLDEY